MKLHAWSLLGAGVPQRLPVPEHPLGVFTGDAPRWIEASDASDADLNGIADALQLETSARENFCNASRSNRVFLERRTILLEFPCAVDVGCDPHPYVSILARQDVIISVLRSHLAEPTRLHERLRPHLEAGEPGVHVVASHLLEELVGGTMDLFAGLRAEADELTTRVLAAPLRVPLSEIQRLSRRIQHAALVAEDQLFSVDSLAASLGSAASLAGLMAMLGHIQNELAHLLSLATRLTEQLRSTQAHAASARDALTSARLRLLTVISAIFLPLNLIGAIYGMNFVRDADHPWNMPELGWRYGYFFCLGLMAVTAAALLLFFWRRGWFGGDSNDDDCGEGGK